MDYLTLLALAPSYLIPLLTAAAFTHAALAARKMPPQVRLVSPRVIIVCLLHLLFAAAVYWHLVTHGWFDENYHWDDPNNINLVLAVFEPLCAAAVAALAITRKPFFYKLLIDLLILQLLAAACFLAVVLIFVLTYKPRMM
jgi:hypothetical protein